MAYTHCMGLGQGQGPGNDGFLYYTMYCTQYRDRDRYKEPLFSIEPILFPVPVPVSVPCSLSEPLVEFSYKLTIGASKKSTISPVLCDRKA